MEFKIEQLVDSFTKRYIEDVAHKTSNELFAIFDIIMEEYQKTNKCPICTEGTFKNKGRYNYNDVKIGLESGIFFINDEVISFTIRANYCPICGNKIKD